MRGTALSLLTRRHITFSATVLKAEIFQCGTWAYGDPPSEAPQISSAEAHTGKYSAYFPAEPEGDFACLGTDFTPQSTIDFRFYMNLAAKTGSGWFDGLTEL